MLDAQACSLICPRNDLESATLLDIADELGVHTIAASSDWGTRLAQVLPAITLEELHHHVLIVELPGDAEVAQLRARGHSVHVIDHHQYSESSATARPARWSNSPRCSTTNSTAISG